MLDLTGGSPAGHPEQGTRKHPLAIVCGKRILSRRGSPAGPRTENTVPALTEAFVSGADGVHVDLRLSADGVLVLEHAKKCVNGGRGDGGR